MAAMLAACGGGGSGPQPPHTVGGSVSGLKSSGLVLANGSDTLSVPSGATTFKMPKEVAVNTSYAITISSQPAGDNCTVGNGSGTLTSGSITNVTITCTPKDFHVSGTISGLGNETGLVLQLNGTDLTTIPAGATSFALNGVAPNATTYTVSVKSHPVAINCTISNGTGTVAAADITNVALSCGIGYLQLYGFAGGNDGAVPRGRLMQASDGKLYGMTVEGGGAANAGTIYSFDPVTGAETVLHSFAGAPGDGAQPEGSLIQATDGKLYGLTRTGGTENRGIFFRFDPVSRNLEILHSFSLSGGDGLMPYGSPLEVGTGKFYMLTSGGGSAGFGAVAAYETAFSSYGVIHSFAGPPGDGSDPRGSLIRHSNGLLYGLTRNGGGNDVGTIFSIDPATDTEAMEFSLGSQPSGTYPEGSLVEGSNHHLYGMAQFDGVGGTGGILFDYDLGAHAQTVLHSFTGNSSMDGNSPVATLIQASDGNLYGTARLDGAQGQGFGTVFRYSLTDGFLLLHTFTAGPDGAYPASGLIQASDGDLYGTAYDGGTHSCGIAVGCGTIFKIN